METGRYPFYLTVSVEYRGESEKGERICVFQSVIQNNIP